MLAQSNIEMQEPQISHFASGRARSGLCSSPAGFFHGGGGYGFIQCGSYLRVCKIMYKDMAMLDIC